MLEKNLLCIRFDCTTVFINTIVILQLFKWTSASVSLLMLVVIGTPRGVKTNPLHRPHWRQGRGRLEGSCALIGREGMADWRGQRSDWFAPRYPRLLIGRLVLID